MTSSFVAKRLVGFTRSTFAPIRPSIPSHRRCFTTDSPPDVFNQSFGNRILFGLLNRFPHTLSTTTNQGQKNISLGKGQNISLNIPGKTKKKKTDEGSVCVFLDMGFEKWDDCEDKNVDTILDKERKALFIKAYLQEGEIRRNYTARINLPEENISDPVYTEIKDGVLMLTIPKAISA